MTNSKLIRILTVLSNDELKQLERFLKSVFYNENENVIQLFLYLRKQAPDWKPEKLERKKVWKKIMGVIPFNEVSCRKLMSNLVLLIEKFIMQAISTHQAGISQLFSFYIDRYLTKDAEDCMKEWEEEQQSKLIQNSDFYLLQMDIARNKMRLPVQTINPKSQSLVTDYLYAGDIQYIITQLQWQTVMMNNTAIVAFQYSSPFIPAILYQIETDAKWLAIPAIYIYYHLYKMMETQSDLIHYEKLNEASEIYTTYLSQDEWVYIASFLQNFCIRKILAGEAIFNEKLHQLYVHQLKTGLIFNYNQIKATTFKNIVSSAIACHYYTWATSFIHDYKDKLPEDERDSLVSYCHAMIHFEQKKYKNVLTCLNEIYKTNHIFRELEVKVLRIRTFYELQELESMNASLDSLKVHISRQASLSQFYKTRFKNFTNFLYRICHIPEMEKEKWLKLQTELNEMKDSDFLHKDWLMQKIIEKGRLAIGN